MHSKNGRQQKDRSVPIRGDLVRVYRESRRWEQETLARKIGGKQTLKNLKNIERLGEKGVYKEVFDKTIEAYAGALGVDKAVLNANTYARAASEQTFTTRPVPPEFQDFEVTIRAKGLFYGQDPQNIQRLGDIVSLFTSGLTRLNAAILDYQQQILLDHNSRYIIYQDGLDESGRHFWRFVAVRRAMIADYNAKLQAGRLDFTDRSLDFSRITPDGQGNEGRLGEFIEGIGEMVPDDVLSLINRSIAQRQLCYGADGSLNGLESTDA